ncbi:MAG: CbtA family protein [Mycobacteriales bacterium]
MTITGSLKRGLVAGLCAGLLAALFAFVVAEPTMDRSIALEESRAAATAHQGDHPYPISRDTQRRFGAPAGFLLVGAALGLLFGLLYAGLRGREEHWRRSLMLGAAAVAVALIVFVRYPPNPPGVGDTDTVDERTRYYFAALLLGVAVVAGAWRISRHLAARGWPASHRHAVSGLGAIAVIGAAYAVLPTPDDDATIPATLLWDFRMLSLGVQLLLLGGTAAVFGLLTERASRDVR